MGHLLSSAIKMQKAVATAGTISVTNYEDALTCSASFVYKNGSFYISAGGDGGTSSGTISTGDTFFGGASSDCYGFIELDVFSTTRGYLYSSSSSISFGPGLTSGTYTRLAGENIAVTGYFYGFDPPPPCFVAGTMIKLADGTEVPIETLSVGSNLESVLIDTLEDTNDAHTLHMWSSNDLIETRTSSSISVFYPEEVNYTIIVNGGLLETTHNHIQLARVNGIWRMIKMTHLSLGDILYDYDGNLIPVTSIEINREPRTVYKLTLSDTSHTYFANNILTHNIKAPGGFE
jgi:hypothetical protein